jgi:uncharacterized protein (TIGR02145 family)/uncharacterized repeat protein (TIGR02543 family)
MNINAFSPISLLAVCLSVLLGGCDAFKDNPLDSENPDQETRQFSLTTTATNGTVSLSPSGGTYDSGTVVMVTASPASGYVFSGWTGACAGTGTCAVTMNAAKSVGASFAKTATGPSSDIPWQTGITYGSVTDPAGQTYKTVRIGTQTWMAENLNYAGASGAVGKCSNNSADSCVKYGRLYTWAEAMQGTGSSATSPGGVQGICPSGWHVPSDGEWTTLQEATGSASAKDGKMLKSISGWGVNTGTDDYGFRVLPAGNIDGDLFVSPGILAHFWSSSEYSTAIAWARSLYYDNANMVRYYEGKTFGFSLRCLKD